MSELRQLVAYVFALVSVICLLAFGVRIGLVEGAQYLPVTPRETNALNSGAELASGPVVRADSEHPVWIAPTPKYHYDPKLMIVKSKEERQKEAEIRRAKELASHQANKREAQLKRIHSLRKARESFAYAPDQRRPDFQVYPFTIQ